MPVRFRIADDPGSINYTSSKAATMTRPAPLTIPTEPIGSIPRPVNLIEKIARGDSEDPSRAPLYEDAIRDTIERFEATGSPVVTDGLMGDRVQLQQVVMNLMLNGIDAMKEVDGVRELAVKSQRTEKAEVLVSVSDTGVGLPLQQADQIFKAFFTTKVQGTGMGLSISRSIVESHGGRLWAGNNSTRGASFYFTLPTKVEARE